MLARLAGLPIEQTRRRVGAAIEEAIDRVRVEDAMARISGSRFALSSRDGDFCRRRFSLGIFGAGSGSSEIERGCCVILAMDGYSGVRLRQRNQEQSKSKTLDGL